MPHELSNVQIESLIFLGQYGKHYSKQEITELGIFPPKVLPPKVLPEWVAQTIKKSKGKFFIDEVEPTDAVASWLNSPKKNDED